MTDKRTAKINFINSAAVDVKRTAHYIYQTDLTNVWITHHIFPVHPILFTTSIW